jgi:hypothetical protein
MVLNCSNSSGRLVILDTFTPLLGYTNTLSKMLLVNIIQNTTKLQKVLDAYLGQIDLVVGRARSRAK